LMDTTLDMRSDDTSSTLASLLVRVETRYVR
jgi:hypothetical protein